MSWNDGRSIYQACQSTKAFWVTPRKRLKTSPGNPGNAKRNSAVTASKASKQGLVTPVTAKPPRVYVRGNACFSFLCIVCKNNGYWGYLGYQALFQDGLEVTPTVTPKLLRLPIGPLSHEFVGGAQ